MPFLEVLTRTCKRPRMLAANQASLRAQTCGDWTQTLLVDEVGRGIGWSHENMAAYAPHLVGDYIWCLDDDDLCIRESFVADLQLAGATQNADLIMVRMDHGPLGILPPDELWGQRPVRNHIGMSAFVAERSLWQRWAHKMTPGKYDADYELVSALFDHAERVIWLDVVASRVQQIGLGRPEPLVSVIMPTLGRASQAARCIRGLFETTRYYVVECIVVCGTADTETPAAVSDIPGVIVLQRDQDDPVTAWNQGAEIARGEWLVLGADDVVFGRGWLRHALAAATDGKDFIGLDDGNYYTRNFNGLPPWAAHYMVSRRHLIEVQGGVLAIPVYKHWWVDVEMSHRAQRAGRYVFAEAAKVLHYHPDTGNAPMDATYERAWPLHEADKVTYQARRAQGFPTTWEPVLR